MFDSIVALMRATALHAALLSDGAEMPAIPFWRARCSNLVETLQQQMQDRSFPATDIKEVSLAQCVLLDELTLHALPSKQHEEWLRDPLQKRFHGVRDGAALVWERIEAVVNGGGRDLAWLEFYSVLLGLGFDGGRGDTNAYLKRAKSTSNSHRCDTAVLSISDVPDTAMTLSNSIRPSDRSHVPHLRRTVAGFIVGAIAVASLWAVLGLSRDAAIPGLPQSSSQQSTQ
ncbi:DotU family type IV/VI secretion system protein [Paraburkholderia atlantica]|uniref:DotU family type IV/VI secretion system protein n=1 Tax=Paraburkholderia atlantica TaxID=2654982 RepID=UPI001616538D|nr:DotU family type IV/VI secretion system protein [Paraburkholderia atlantica]MBB5508817.1 type VI secretion system protein ImpK [Paraburkholderia atlantica]